MVHSVKLEMFYVGVGDAVLSARLCWFQMLLICKMQMNIFQLRALKRFYISTQAETSGKTIVEVKRGNRIQDGILVLFYLWLRELYQVVLDVEVYYRRYTKCFLLYAHPYRFQNENHVSLLFTPFSSSSVSLVLLVPLKLKWINKHFRAII